MTRVSNYAQYLLNQTYNRNTQARMKEANLQLASGKVAQRYDQLGAASFKLLSVETSYSRSQQFIRNIDRASGRMDIMESTVSTIVDRAVYLLSQLSSALSSNNADYVALKEMGDGFMQEVAGLLNVNHEGRYLFAGSRADQPPVDLTAYDPTAGLPGGFAPDTSYYQGDHVLATVRADEDFELTYGMAADEPAFEQLMRALAYVKWAGDPAVPTADRDAVLQEAFDLTNQAIDGLSALRSRIGAQSSVLDSARSSHDSYLTYSENTIAGIEDADPAEAITRLTNEQVQLQASYMALSRLSSMSLLDFLR
jgi:flagellar hook-associated protein 3 FlgL